MTKRLKDQVKLDIGLVSQALNNTNATGRYYSMKNYRQALAVLVLGAMAAGTTADVEFLQAKDAAGTGAKVIANAKATITANTNVTVLQCVLGLPANGDTITINGLVFTKAAATDAATRAFADAAGLVTCVNNATYGVPGVSASDNAGTLTYIAVDPGETLITATKTGAALTLSTVQAIAYVEITASELDIAGGFTHVAAKVTTTANSNASVDLVRGLGRFMPDQKVGASAAL